MQKKLYTMQQVAEAYGHPYTTTHNHITKLKLLGKFEKSPIESSFTEADIKQLEKELDFKIKR